MVAPKKKIDIMAEIDRLTGESAGHDASVKKKPSRLSIVKGEKKRPLSPFFYKVSNHHELFKIGNSFYNDFKNGVKSFAISSIGYQNSQQRSILGLASFFDHQEDLKIAIISDNLYLGAFKEMINAGKSNEIIFDGLDEPFEIHSFYEHFDFIDLNELTAFADSPDTSMDEILDQLMDMYDVVFWDVPELFKIQSNKETFFPIIMRFDSLSIIVAKSATNKNEVDDVKSFFLGYGINLKGLLLEPGAGNQSPIEQYKHWWKRLFK